MEGLHFVRKGKVYGFYLSYFDHNNSLHKFNWIWCWQRLHCGCIASKSMLELLDGGGVNCTSCSKSAGVNSVRSFFIGICFSKIAGFSLPFSPN